MGKALLFLALLGSESMAHVAKTEAEAPAYVRMNYHQLGVWAWELDVTHLSDDEVGEFCELVTRCLQPQQWPNETEKAFRERKDEHYKRCQSLRGRLMTHGRILGVDVDATRLPKRLGRFRISKRVLR